MTHSPGRRLTPPTNRGGERVRERWEEEVSKILDSSTITLDDTAQLFFTLLSDKTSDLEDRITALERRIEWLSLQKSL